MTFTEKKALVKWFYNSGIDYNTLYNISMKLNGIPPVWITNINELVAIYLYVKFNTVY